MCYQWFECNLILSLNSLKMRLPCWGEVAAVSDVEIGVIIGKAISTVDYRFGTTRQRMRYLQ